jgi:hypothetical protein
MYIKDKKAEFKPKLKEPSLLKCLIKIFHGKFLAGSFLKLVQDLLGFVGPRILNSLISFTQDPKQREEVGYLFVFLLMFSSIIQSLVVQHYFHRMFIVGGRIRTSLIGLIYKKVKKIYFNIIRIK